MEKTIQIGKKKIGEGRPCFIIAEAGVNHNGSIETAKKLVDAAVASNADAIKFQTFRAEDMVTTSASMASYQEKNIGKKDSQFNMLKKLELSEHDHKILKEYCNKKNIIFSSTPHSSYADVDLLESLEVPFFKIGSGDLVNLPFVEYIAKKGKPIIISSGMGNLQECRETVETIRASNQQIVFLHCTTNYPSPESMTNLNAIKTMQKELGVLIGYSDHTEGITASAIAVSFGACVVEKHLTLDRSMEGPDHKASMEYDEFSDFVKAIRLVENKDLGPMAAIEFINDKLGLNLNPNIRQMLGNGVKRPYAEELEVAKVARKSIVAAKDLKAGTIIKESDLSFKRPGEGLSPKFAFGKYNVVVGKTLKTDVEKDQQITKGILG